jgi:hypothetical protein
MSRRQKIVVCAVFAALALLHTGAVAMGAGGGTGDAGGPQNAFVRWLGRLAGPPAPVAAAELTADCLADTTFTVRGSCTVHVAASHHDLRQLRLHTQDAVTVTARTPHRDAMVHHDVAAGADVSVTVDGTDGEITLACAGTTTCLVTLS